MVSSQAQRLLDRFLCVSGSDWGSFISERHPEEKKKGTKVSGSFSDFRPS